MFTFATDYFLFVLIATLGVIQLAASVEGLKAILFFKNPFVARILGLILIVIGFVLFFSTGERNINDYEGGLDANAQSLFFFLAAISAGLITFSVTSIVNMNMKPKNVWPTKGLDNLKTTVYVQILIHNWKYWSRNWRQQMKNYFSG